MDILERAAPSYQRGRGREADMRPMAVRAYMIRRFNPAPDKPSESTVSWAELADLLFLNNGKCSRQWLNVSHSRFAGRGGTIVHVSGNQQLRRDGRLLTNHRLQSFEVK
jgi:hypothetical protein